METKQKRVKVILSIILPIFIIMGMLAVSGNAEKPEVPPGQSKKESPPEPIWISVSGAIEGLGDPYEFSVKLVDPSFGYGPGQLVVANPDYPPALKVSGPRKKKRLIYYYCDHPDHVAPEGICNDPSHDPPDNDPPSSYKCLHIYGGAVEGREETEQIRFPAGSTCRIYRKVNLPDGNHEGELLLEGTLSMEAIYKVLEWSN